VTPEQLLLVAQTTEPVLAQRDRFATHFYGLLFESAPETRALFPTDLTEQKGKVVDELAFLSEAARHLDPFLERARDLGRRHGRYGVRPTDFAPVEAALLGALADSLGAAWTDEAEAAWRRLFHLVAETMLEGLNETLFADAD
jgi:hemoglobin-like flavoprotein